MDQRRLRRTGFTLVELLVVIAIIGVLVGLLLPAVQAAREAARRMSCANNLKQIGLAFHNYESTYSAFPASWYVNPPAPPYNLQSSGVGLLPFLEQEPLHSQYDTSFSATNEGGPISQANVVVISTPLATFVCPSAPGGIDRIYDGIAPAGSLPGLPQITWRAAPSDYCVTSGVLGTFAAAAYADHGGPGGSRHGALLQTTFAAPKSNRMATITDGTSHTFLMGERTGGNRFYSGTRQIDVPAPYSGLQGGGWGDPLNGEHWLAGTVRNPTFPAPEGTCAINCSNLRGSSFHSFHPGGCHFLMADASVQFLSESVAPFPLAARITREKGEAVGALE
ncbi:DUF1559 domain-containing protein [Candidatus Laterigemmans baculatus]|uniref:DUF1559 domain-containing protein n=1 Tax=Candidatus Laterigemmans baculatus TaxID=2770505 RepID=UPI0013DA70A2|nr:DUF1559 domain-containing protein [Candidatus Laterigemmans baculatus]